MAERNTYSVSFSTNGTGGWRRAIGNALRRVAEAIDGRWSIAIAIKTEPPLSMREQAEAIRFGLKRIGWAVTESTHEKALEQILAGKEEDRHGAPA